ncbi:GntR family transcriptional regulator [Agrobacterium tumefaciens]|uniref:GntR family transcriptional regulator n=2 Tax=Agrobacterium TaxID=357 RepID=UPI00384B46E0
MIDILRDESDTGAQGQRMGSMVYDVLRERMIRGSYPPGHKFTVRGIAGELDVSTTPARDALNRLTTESVLVFSGPKTLVVPTLTRAELRDITVTRIALEGTAAEYGARNPDEASIKKLMDIQGIINTSLEEGRYHDALWHNKEFHFAIYNLCGMTGLLSMIETLWARIGPTLLNLYPEYAQNRQGVHNHMVAIEALIDKDPAGVRAAIENDIREGYRKLRNAASITDQL